MGKLDRKDLRGFKDQRDHKDSSDLRGLRDWKAYVDHLALQGWTGRLVQLALKAIRDLSSISNRTLVMRGRWDLLDWKVRLDRLGQLVPRDQQVLKVFKEKRDRLYFLWEMMVKRVQ